MAGEWSGSVGLDTDPGEPVPGYTPAMTRRRTRLRRWILGLALGMLAAVAVLLLFLAATWPDVSRLASHDPSTTAFIEHARASGLDIRWQWVPYDAISDELKRAVLVAEDVNFFSHRGFDAEELSTAVREAIRGERLRGASTLTQQLAKNLWLTPSRSPVRKLREALLTWQLERELNKHRILELYLNVVEFGPGIYGAEAAAAAYFGKTALSLTAQEAAELAAALPRPKSWHPGVVRRGYLAHVARIRARMARAGWLDRLI
jgi:monofunctional biosynthetic peptidoglycan transglycosylase